MSTRRQVLTAVGCPRPAVHAIPAAWRLRLAATMILLLTALAGITTIAAEPATASPSARTAAASGPLCPAQSAHNTAVTASDFTKVSGVVPRPVVLVHGWDSSYKSMQGYASLLKISKVLHEPLAPFLFDYSANSGRWAAIPAIAACLAAYVNQVSRAYHDAGGDGRVLSVGHSMGGLAIRFSASATYAAQPDGAVLGGVVTIDTPHLGSPWGYTAQAQLLQNLIQNTSGNVLEGMIPWPPGGDGQVCLATHTGSSGMPPGCATPSWLPASVPVAEIGGDITVHRQVLGYDVATSNTGGDAVVQTSSSLGYQPASGPGAAPAPVQPPLTYVDSCDLTTGQVEAGLAGFGVSLVKGEESLILSLGTPAGNESWNSPLTKPVATFLSLANISAPCSHTNIENPATDPFASLDVLKALNADLDRLDAGPTNESDLASLLGPWSVHDSSLCIGQSLDLGAAQPPTYAPPCSGSAPVGWIRAWQGCNMQYTGSPVCNEWLPFTYTVSPDGTLHGTISGPSIYTGDNNVVIPGLNYPYPYMEPGDTFTLKLAAAGLLTGTENSTAPGVSSGVIAYCNYNTISPTNQRQYCGA